MSAGNDQDTPKLIIDSDWKSQARQEKEKLSQKADAPKAQASGGSAAPQGAPGEAPTEPGIQDIISLLMTQALTYMGAFPDPKSGRAVVSLEMARVFIELLKVLEDKTKGNLTEQESTVMSRVLSELRMEYVEMSKYLEQAIAEGKVKPVTQGGVVSPSTGVSAPGMPNI